jgi:protocatechuate 3,4-dioxygenase beta subunit
MKRWGIVAAVAVVALIGVFAWRPAEDAPPPRESPLDTPAPITRADTRAARPPQTARATIHGFVARAESEMPDAGRDVELLRAERVVDRATTDSHGAFAFHSVDPHAIHEVRVTADGCRTVRVTGLALLPDESRDIGVLVLGAPRVVPITVTDETGKPVPDTVVELYREARGGMSEYERHRVSTLPEPVALVTLDAKGEGELQLEPQGPHTVAAHAPGHARVEEALVEILLHDFDRIRLVLPPAHTLSGTVVDPAGAPVADAVVLARKRPRVWDHYHGERANSSVLWHTARTDASGAFAFDRLAPGTIDLAAARAGELPAHMASVVLPGVESLRLELRESASVGGRTLRSGGDEPLAGVVVAYRAGLFAGTTVSDAAGHWHVDGLPSRVLCHVGFDPPAGWTGPVERGPERVPSGSFGGRFQETLHPAEHLPIDVTFERAAVIEGMVTSDGAPAAAAWVRAVTLAERLRPGSRTVARSDANGRFRVEDVAPGRVILQAVPAGMTWSDAYSAFYDVFSERYDDEEARDAAALDLPPGAVLRHDLETWLPDGYETSSARMARMDARFAEDAGPRIHVNGRITTSDGLPLRGVQVTIREGPAPEEIDVDRSFDLYPATVTADGRYEGVVERLYERSAAIHVIAMDARHDATAVEARLTKERLAEGVTIDVVLEPRPLLHGRVMSGGQPVADAALYLGGALVARSGADGTFAHPVRTGADHHPGVLADGFVRAQLEYVEVPQEEPLVVELVPARTLTGTVVDAAGEPVAGVLVGPVDEDGDPLGGYGDWYHGPSLIPARTDEHGRFVLEEVPRAAVHLEITPAEHGDVGTARFIAGPFDADESDVRVVAHAPRRLKGRVVFPDGVERKRVRIHGVALEDAQAAGGGDHEASAGMDGSFAFDDLLTAAYRLSAIPPRSTGLQPVEVDIAPDQEHVDVVLEAAEVISGNARWLDGSPFAPDLLLRPLDHVAAGVSKWNLRVDIEDDGTFRVFVQRGVRYAIGLYREDWSDDIRITGGEGVLAGTRGVVITASRVVDGVDESARAEGVVSGTETHRGRGGDRRPGAGGRAGRDVRRRRRVLGPRAGVGGRRRDGRRHRAGRRTLLEAGRRREDRHHGPAHRAPGGAHDLRSTAHRGRRPGDGLAHPRLVDRGPRPRPVARGRRRRRGVRPRGRLPRRVDAGGDRRARRRGPPGRPPRHGEGRREEPGDPDPGVKSLATGLMARPATPDIGGEGASAQGPLPGR